MSDENVLKVVLKPHTDLQIKIDNFTPSIPLSDEAYEKTFDSLEYLEEGIMKNLIKQVEQWSVDKGLDKADPNRQALKVWEESGEIASALSRGNLDELKDGIGDTVVTLIILAQQHGWTLRECLEYAYDEIKGRKGKTINGTFIKSEDL